MSTMFHLPPVVKNFGKLCMLHQFAEDKTAIPRSDIESYVRKFDTVDK